MWSVLRSRIGRASAALVVVAALGLPVLGSHAPAPVEVRLAVPAVEPEPAVPAPPVVPPPASAVWSGTGWPALDAAIARIPGYATAAPTSWRVSDRYGHLGSTLLPAEQVSISPGLQPGLLDAVVRHEWSHVLQSRAYGGDVPAMVAALDAAFGGAGARGVDGVENAADCMARELGATWTHYTDCRDPRWRASAARLLAGQRL